MNLEFPRNKTRVVRDLTKMEFFEPKVMASFKYLLGFNCVLEVAGRHGVISSLPSTSVFMKVIEGSGSG